MTKQQADRLIARIQEDETHPNYTEAGEIGRVVEGSAPPDMALRVQAHIEGCSRCKEILELLALLSEGGR